MASNAERQANYRKRHLKDESGALSRLNVMISFQGKIRLERLASCYGVTQRAMLERLLEEEESALLDSLSSKDATEYYDKRLTVTA